MAVVVIIPILQKRKMRHWEVISKFKVVEPEFELHR